MACRVERGDRSRAALLEDAIVLVIDTSALISIFRLEPEADSFLKAIVRAQGRAMSALSILEASMVMSGGGDAAAFEPLDEFLIEAGIEIAAFDAAQSRLARDALSRSSSRIACSTPRSGTAAFGPAGNASSSRMARWDWVGPFFK